MRCFYLLLVLVCLSIIATAQELPQQTVYNKLLQKKDWKSAASAAMQLSKQHRKEASFSAAIYFDSIAVTNARLAADTPLLQKALNSYVRSLSDAFRLTEAQRAIQSNNALFESWNNSEKCNWHHTKAAILFKNMQNDGAIAECRKGVLIAAALQDTAATMQLQTLLGRILVMKGKVDSVQLAFEAFEYFRHTSFFSDAAQAASVIAFAFVRTANPDKALSYYQQAEYFFKKDNDQQNAAQMRMNEGDAWLVKKDFAAAKESFIGGQHFFEQKQQTSGLAFALIRMGQLYTESGVFDSASYYLKAAELLAKSLAVPAVDFVILGLKAKLHLKTGQFDKVQEEGKIAVGQLQQHADIDIIKDLSGKLEAGSLLQNGEEKQDNRFLHPQSKKLLPDADTLQLTDSAVAKRLGQLSPYTGSHLADDSGIIARNNQVMQEMEARYQKKESDLQLVAQQQEIHINKLEAAQSKQHAEDESRKSIGISIGSAIIILLIGTGLWVQYKSRRRAERDRAQIAELQAEIHHRVTNNLGVINAMVDMAAKASTSQLSMSALKTRIDSIALVHRLLYSGTAATGKIALQPYFESLSTAIATIFERDKAVKITVAAPVETDSVLAEKLGLIVNELITNSFKYAFTAKENGTIHLYARQQANELYLKVADNGSGLPEDAKKGQGSKLIKGLCHQLKGKYSYQNVNGAFFEMTVPV